MTPVTASVRIAARLGVYMKATSLALSIALSCACAWGQATSQIQGVVTDATGAAVPGADVKATQTDTSTVRSATTGADGGYVLSNLAIGPYKLLIIPRTPDEKLGDVTSLVTDAHAQGLLVHPWTFRVENTFLPGNFKQGADPTAHGNLEGEIRQYLRTGIDGFFTDNADIGFRAREAFIQ